MAHFNYLINTMLNDLYYGFLTLFRDKQALLYFSQKKEAKQLYTFLQSEEHNIVKTYLVSHVEKNKSAKHPFLIQPFHEKINLKHPLILALIYLNRENFILFCNLLAPHYEAFTPHFIQTLLDELSTLEDTPFENIIYRDESHKLKKAIKTENLQFFINNYLMFHLDKFDLDYTFKAQNKMKENLPKNGFVDKVVSFFSQNITHDNQKQMVGNYPLIAKLLEKVVEFHQHPQELKTSYLEKEKIKKVESDSLQALFHLILSNRTSFNSGEFFRLTEIVELLKREKKLVDGGENLNLEQEYYLKKVVSYYLPDLIQAYLNISDEHKYIRKENKDSSPSEIFQLALEDIMIQIASFRDIHEENKAFDLEQKQNFIKNKTLSLKA